MSDDNNINNKKLSRRGLFTAGGVFALAGLGVGTGALWNVSDGFSGGIVSTGNLQAVKGKTTPYVGRTVSPTTNQMVNGSELYRIDSDGEIPHVYGTQNNVLQTIGWVTDYTFINNGENMQAAITPKLDINLDAILKYLPPEQRDDTSASFFLSVILEQIDHDDSIILGVPKTQDKPVYYTIASAGGRTYFSPTSDSLPYDYEEQFAEDGRDIEEEDPTGEYRRFTYNYDPESPTTPTSINIPKGEVNMSVVMYKTIATAAASDNFSNFVKDGIFIIEDAIDYSFQLNQIRR